MRSSQGAGGQQWPPATRPAEGGDLRTRFRERSAPLPPCSSDGAISNDVWASPSLGWLGGHCFVLPALPAASSTRAAPDRGGVVRPASPPGLGREGIPWDLAARVPEFYAGGPYNGHGEANQLVLSSLCLLSLDVR